MRLRPWHTFAIFGLSLMIAIAGVAWLSARVIALDRAEAKARRQALVEENVRLALWRLDSEVAPIVAAEAARPYFWYAAFHDADRPYDRMLSGSGSGSGSGAHARLVASPLLLDPPPHALIHFQYAGGEGATSPQAPEGLYRALAISSGISSERIEDAEEKLRAVEALAPRSTLSALLQSEEPPVPSAPSSNVKSENDWSKRGKLVRQSAESNSYLQRQVIDNATEIYNPTSAREQVLAAQKSSPRAGAFAGEGADSREDGSLRPIWAGEALLLVRRAEAGGTAYLQGCRLDWERLRGKLLAEIQDLLPGARLEAISSHEQTADSRRLASIPVRLDPGLSAGGEDSAISLPVMATLSIAWAGLLLAALAAGALLAGATTLSERRADFVSAVTHELRTPLTTFRMYTEMLAEGMVPEDRRGNYLETLRREASRLSHLVENVLSFARIERGRHTGSRERLAVPVVVERFADRLIDRAAQAELTVVLDLPEESLDVMADASAIEHILFNLVDNACKYAASATDRRIRIEAARARSDVIVRVRDFGPGVSELDRRRLFSPFSKSAARAATSAPGVGLGLALSRRLARTMGGDLVLETARGEPGASFVLSIPAAR